MIGLLVVAHGDLATEILKATEHVVGPLEAARAIGLGPKDELSSRRAEIAQAIEDIDQGAGVIVLTDLFGGTPSNLAIAAMGSENVDVITGVNLPMMMRLARSRDKTRAEAVASAVEAGRKYILAASDVLGGPHARDKAISTDAAE
ncbi:MAG: PTS sugar transporter subunit IIA [Pseudomonadota bacterium]